jgi:hypothetical protein
MEMRMAGPHCRRPDQFPKAVSPQPLCHRQRDSIETGIGKIRSSLAEKAQIDTEKVTKRPEKSRNYKEGHWKHED